MRINAILKLELIQQSAVTIYRHLGYSVPDDYDFHNSQHPTEQAILRAAIAIVENCIERIG